MAKQWKVSEVAKLAHVTVRTLHHYDQIGLLVPSERSPTGYRLYSITDLKRLHQILLYQELGFSLEAISQILDEPAFDRRGALRTQRELLAEKLRKTKAVMRALDRNLEAMEGGAKMSTEEMFDGFEELADAPEDIRAHHRKHGKEAAEHWGQTDAYKESMRRVKKYGKQDWERIRQEGEENEARMASLQAEGADPEAKDAVAAAEAMRQHISRWFYPCDHGMHSGLADMYEADERFRAHYDNRAPGLASFVARAIRANAGLHERKRQT